MVRKALSLESWSKNPLSYNSNLYLEALVFLDIPLAPFFAQAT